MVGVQALAVSSSGNRGAMAFDSLGCQPQGNTTMKPQSRSDGIYQAGTGRSINVIAPRLYVWVLHGPGVCNPGYLIASLRD